MMNSPFMIDRARELARRLAAEAEGVPQRIDRAYRLLFARPPTARELSIGQRFLTQAKQPIDTATNVNEPKLSAWEQYAQILLSANEFMHVR